MHDTFSTFDAADYLVTEADIAAYLEASAEDGDPAAMAAALGAVARARNISQVARDAGMTREGIYKALAPTGNPAFATVTKIARALGYEVTFRPIAAPPTAPETAEPAGSGARKRRVGTRQGQVGAKA